MSLKEHYSPKEKAFFKVKKEWLKSFDSRDLNTRSSVDLSKVKSLRQLFNMAGKEVIDDVDKHQVEVCVDCGKIYKTTFEFRGKIPMCNCCGKVLTSIPKVMVSQFNDWHKNF